MQKRAFLFTPGDGRPTANAFWITLHMVIIATVEKILGILGYKSVWLHEKDQVVSSETMASEVARILVAKKPVKGDLLIPLTTGWNWPAHCGIIFATVQQMIRDGKLQVINVCNMKEKAPGYVGQRANVLCLDIMELPYSCITVIDQSDTGWDLFKRRLQAVLDGTYRPYVPTRQLEITDDNRRVAREVLLLLQQDATVVELLGVSSMTMYQGWPLLHQFLRAGITPVYTGGNQFRQAIMVIRQADVDAVYKDLRSTGLQIIYGPAGGGLTRKEIDLALRMYLYKLRRWQAGIRGFGTQGQMDHIGIVATDVSETLMMSSRSPGKEAPVIDVTESDCEALFSSMIGQAIQRVLTGKQVAVGFHDIRHYNADADTLVLLNSGALALDFMTNKPGDYHDIKIVSQNRDVYFLNGGGCAYGNMQPSDLSTLFRWHQVGGSYNLSLGRIRILPLSWALRQQIYGELDKWPMGIVQALNEGGTEQPTGITVSATEGMTLAWTPNHGQHVEGDIAGPLAAFAELMGQQWECYA